MAIMITGGTGFLGAYLARYLVTEVGRKDVVIFEQAPNIERIEDIQDRVTLVRGDVLEPLELLGAMDKYGVEQIIHLAYILSVGSNANPPRAVSINCRGTANIFDTARQHGAKRVVYASSVAVHGHRDSYDDEEVDEDVVPRPNNLYGSCKLFNEHLAELYWNQHGLDVIGLRPISVFGLGRGQRVSSTPTHFMVLPEIAAVEKAISMPPDNQIVDWIYAADAAAAWYNAVIAEEPMHRVFHMSAERRPIGDATKFMRSVLPNVSIKVDEQPTGALRLVKSDRIRNELGFKPKYTLEQGLLHYMNIVREKAEMPPLDDPGAH